MYVAGLPRLVNDDLRRHPSQPKQLDFLPVHLENRVFGVWQAHKWQIVFLPILLKSVSGIGANHDNFCIQDGKLVIILAQLRHVPAAKWSDKTPVQNQNHIVLPLISG